MAYYPPSDSFLSWFHIFSEPLALLSAGSKNTARSPCHVETSLLSTLRRLFLAVCLSSLTELRWLHFMLYILYKSARPPLVQHQSPFLQGFLLVERSDSRAQAKIWLIDSLLIHLNILADYSHWTVFSPDLGECFQKVGFVKSQSKQCPTWSFMKTGERRE